MSHDNERIQDCSSTHTHTHTHTHHRVRAAALLPSLCSISSSDVASMKLWMLSKVSRVYVCVCVCVRACVSVFAQQLAQQLRSRQGHYGCLERYLVSLSFTYNFIARMTLYIYVSKFLNFYTHTHTCRHVASLGRRGEKQL